MLIFFEIQIAITVIATDVNSVGKLKPLILCNPLHYELSFSYPHIHWGLLYYTKNLVESQAKCFQIAYTVSALITLLARL